MKKLILTLSAILISTFAFAEKIDDVFNAEYLDELKSKGSLLIVHEKKDTDVSVVPTCEYTDMIKSDLICKNDKGTPFLAEFVYLIPKSEIETNPEKKISIDDVSVVFRSISKMNGMTYVHNGGKRDVLYKKAFAIESLDSRTPVADPLEGNADGLEGYSYQHDHTFGDTVYKLNYHQNENTLYATFLSMLPMTKLGIKAIKPEDLRMTFMCMDLEDNLLLYISADLISKPIAGVRAQIEDSMTVRLTAIEQWAVDQMKERAK